MGGVNLGKNDCKDDYFVENLRYFNLVLFIVRGDLFSCVDSIVKFNLSLGGFINFLMYYNPVGDMQVFVLNNFKSEYLNKFKKYLIEYGYCRKDFDIFDFICLVMKLFIK